MATNRGDGASRADRVRRTRRSSSPRAPFVVPASANPSERNPRAIHTSPTELLDRVRGGDNYDPATRRAKGAGTMCLNTHDTYHTTWRGRSQPGRRRSRRTSSRGRPCGRRSSWGRTSWGRGQPSWGRRNRSPSWARGRPSWRGRGSLLEESVDLESDHCDVGVKTKEVSLCAENSAPGSGAIASCTRSRRKTFARAFRESCCSQSDAWIRSPVVVVMPGPINSRIHGLIAPTRNSPSPISRRLQDNWRIEQTPACANLGALFAFVVHV